jgi:hypothetical protein
MQGFKSVQARRVVLAGLFMTLGLTSCAGDVGDTTSDTVTGQFIDSAVGGLAYSCSSGNSGVTDSNGEYTCNEGDTVTFSINGFVLGSATTSEDAITPSTIASDTAQALNIAQLLQTLDVDDDPSNGVSIAQYGEQYDAMGSMADDNVTLDQAGFDTTAGTYINETLVDETTAQGHLDDSIGSMSFNAESIKAALAGKTAYPAQSSPAFSEVWVIAADGLTGTGSGVDMNGSFSNGGTFSYTDTSFTVVSDNPEDGPVTFVVQSITNYYIETNRGKIYYTQADAYPDAIIDAVAGKKVYPQQSSLSYTEEWVFDASGTTGTVTGVDSEGGHVDHIIVTYSGKTFTIINNDPDDADYLSETTFTVLDIASDKITVQVGSEEGGVFYSQNDAYVGL